MKVDIYNLTFKEHGSNKLQNDDDMLIYKDLTFTRNENIPKVYQTKDFIRNLYKTLVNLNGKTVTKGSKKHQGFENNQALLEKILDCFNIKSGADLQKYLMNNN